MFQSIVDFVISSSSTSTSISQADFLNFVQRFGPLDIAIARAQRDLLLPLVDEQSSHTQPSMQIYSPVFTYLHIVTVRALTTKSPFSIVTVFHAIFFFYLPCLFVYDFFLFVFHMYSGTSIIAPYFHGELSREASEELLKADGTYLIRSSSRYPVSMIFR